MGKTLAPRVSGFFHEQVIPSFVRVDETDQDMTGVGLGSGRSRSIRRRESASDRGWGKNHWWMRSTSAPNSSPWANSFDAQKSVARGTGTC